MFDEVPITILGTDLGRCGTLAAALQRGGLSAESAELPAVGAVHSSALATAESPLAPPAGGVLVLLAADASQARRLLAGIAQADERPAIAVMLDSGTSQDRAAIIAAGADECLSNQVDPLELEVRIRRLAAVASIAADAADQRRLLDRELQQARRIQRYIMPLTPPQLPGLEITAEYLPAAVLGGDFFDIIRLDEQKLGLFMADVVGHGVGAALNTMLIKSQLMIWARPGISVCETMALLNQSLSSLVDLEYATAIYGVLDLSRWTFEYSIAGHPSPLLVRPAEGVTSLPVPAMRSASRQVRIGLPLGMFDNSIYVSETLELQTDDRVLLYTDGLIDWRGSDGERLGVHGLLALVEEIRSRPLADQVAWLMHGLRRRGDGAAPDDDVNLLAVRRAD